MILTSFIQFPRLDGKGTEKPFWTGCHCERSEAISVIPAETGIQEGRIAMLPYKIASSFFSSQ
jgi:hypothetical protein